MHKNLWRQKGSVWLIKCTHSKCPVLILLDKSVALIIVAWFQVCWWKSTTRILIFGHYYCWRNLLADAIINFERPAWVTHCPPPPPPPPHNMRYAKAHLAWQGSYGVSTVNILRENWWCWNHTVLKPSNINPVYTWGLISVITVPADALAPHGARVSAGSMMTTKLN